MSGYPRGRVLLPCLLVEACSWVYDEEEEEESGPCEKEEEERWKKKLEIKGI